MTVDIERGSGGVTAGTADSLTTPAGLQAIATLAWRRLAVLTLNLVTWTLLLFWSWRILSTGGWTIVDGIVWICIVLGTPWSVVGFWNAVIGFVMLHVRPNGLKEAAPFLTPSTSAPLAIDTAVLMTLRNEDPGRALHRLRIVKDSLDATGDGARFAYFVLSDTDRSDIAAMEEAAIAAWRLEADAGERITYRRRVVNTGYKAGNLRDFVLRSGDSYELMLPLDADSLMTGPAIVRLVRIMQENPKLGILQSLVVGTPSRAAFARIFQFGMRLGMRTYTMGQAWWVGDCGPFWGHNALVRIKPFRDACALPVLPGAPPLGGHVLSHDQVEATLMRRAGYEVRVMPIEHGSYEDNPPNALEFIRRDVRWCQGNMQYIKLLGLEDLKPVSRFQLVWAILMFIGIPAWTVMIAASPLLAANAAGFADFPVGEAKALYLAFLGMYLAPKLAGTVDAMVTPGEVRRFGGGMRFAVSVAVELVFSFLQGAVTTIRTSLFMAGLLIGRSIVWSGQQRDALRVAWDEAAKALWPQLVFGILVCSALYAVSPAVLVWSLPLTAGYFLAIPFTVLTSSPGLGRWMRRHGIAGIPEDFAPPPEIVALTRAEAE